MTVCLPVSTTDFLLMKYEHMKVGLRHTTYTKYSAAGLMNFLFIQ